MTLYNLCPGIFLSQVQSSILFVFSILNIYRWTWRNDTLLLQVYGASQPQLSVYQCTCAYIYLLAPIWQHIYSTISTYCLLSLETSLKQPLKLTRFIYVNEQLPMCVCVCVCIRVCFMSVFVCVCVCMSVKSDLEGVFVCEWAISLARK